MLKSNIDDGDGLYSLGLERNGAEDGMISDKKSVVEGSNNSERKVAGGRLLQYMIFEIFYI